MGSEIHLLKLFYFTQGRATFKAGVSKQLDGMLAIMNEFPLAEFDS